MVNASKKTCKGKPLRLLVIGTLPPPVGGAGVLLKHLKDALAGRDDIDQIVVNTSGVRGNNIFGGTVQFMRILWQIFRGIWKCDVVSLHASPPGLYLIGPIVCVLVRLTRRPFIVRKFGGFDYRDFKGLFRVLAQWVVRSADLYLVETKFLVEAAKQDGISHVRWYPNNRPKVAGAGVFSRGRSGCRNLIFLSQNKRRLYLRLL